jgi:U3 small nucleolar RNA-associated protein 13
MEQPGRLYNLFRDIRIAATDASAGDGTPTGAGASSITGNAAVDEVVRTLAGAELAKLLRYVRDWNTRAKTAGVAQDVLHAVVKLRSAADVMAAFGAGESSGARAIGFDDEKDRSDGKVAVGGGATGLKELVDALIPYTERHLARMDRLVQESYVVDYLLAEMDGMLGEADDVDAMDVDIGVPMAVDVSA